MDLSPNDAKNLPWEAILAQLKEITQNKLADQLEFSPPALSMVIKGKRGLGRGKYIKLLEKLAFSFDSQDKMVQWFEEVRWPKALINLYKEELDDIFSKIPPHFPGMQLLPENHIRRQPLEDLIHTAISNKSKDGILIWGGSGAGKKTLLHSYLNHQWKALTNRFKAFLWIETGGKKKEDIFNEVREKLKLKVRPNFTGSVDLQNYFATYKVLLILDLKDQTPEVNLNEWVKLKGVLGKLIVISSDFSQVQTSLPTTFSILEIPPWTTVALHPASNVENVEAPNHPQDNTNELPKDIDFGLNIKNESNASAPPKLGVLGVITWNLKYPPFETKHFSTFFIPQIRFRTQKPTEPEFSKFASDHGPKDRFSLAIYNFTQKLSEYVRNNGYLNFGITVISIPILLFTKKYDPGTYSKLLQLLNHGLDYSLIGNYALAWLVIILSFVGVIRTKILS